MSITKTAMAGFFFPLFMCLVLVTKSAPIGIDTRPRILVSTDIGGTDPDDFQSMIHLLMYADKFQIEGLISTAFVGGGKQHLLKMIGLYEEDYPSLVQHSSLFPTAHQLRSVCKQGALGAAPFKGFSASTEGSDWMVQCARRKSIQPLWVLVWGGL